MEKMDFHSVMETFAEAWVAANTHTPLTEAAEQGLINGPANANSGPAANGNNAPTTTNNAPVIVNNVPAIVTNVPAIVANVPAIVTNVPAIVNNVPTIVSNVPANAILSPVNHGSSTQNQPVFTVLQEPPKHPTENMQIMESSRVSGRQSPSDSQSNFTSLGEIRNHKAQDVNAGKCLPVHCIIEQIPGPQACGQYVELDSYAIVPNDTLFSDLVRTALGKLGYSGSQILGAKGSIQVKKWKSLAFDQITENPEATVGDILGDLTTMASLHVRLYSVPDNPQEWKDITVRNAVLELLREMSQIKLAKLCPLSQPMLSNIINNRYMGKIGKEKCQEFGQWYLTYRKEHPEGSVPEVVPSDRPVDGRLTFHPTKELPIMRDWFHACRNPSRRTLQMYVDILNQGSVRQQERPKVILSTLKNWWKNEKQRERKSRRSDDQSPEPNKPKRKKKADDPTVETDPTTENGSQHFSNSNSEDTPPKPNNKFTLINHGENEPDLDRFGKKDSELSESSLVIDCDHHFNQSSPPSVAKDNYKFTLSHTDLEMDHRFSRKDGEPCHDSLVGDSNHHFPRSSSSNVAKDNYKFHDVDVDRNIAENRLEGHIIHPILPMKDSLSVVESPFFHKLHTVCIDHPHGLFGFQDSHLSIQSGSKIFCDSDNSGRTAMVDEGNSHLSSEDDVDVGV